jgi:Rhodopirellula transposase DDE domain
VLLSSPEPQQLSMSQREELRLASSKLSGTNRRYFQASIAIKYCRGNARLTERMFVALGLAEKRTGITCIGSQTGFSGAKRWEEKQPEVAESLVKLAESHSQQDPTFATTIAYTRLTATEALKQLAQQGYLPEQLPSLSTMTEVLNRTGYRLRKVVKAKPKKK